MFLASIILSVLLAVAFLGSGSVKLADAKQSLHIRDQLGVGAQLWRVIGALEVAAAVGAILLILIIATIIVRIASI